MTRWATSVLLAVCGALSNWRALADTKPEQPKPLRPGAYSLSLTATEGSRQGGVAEGALMLVAPRATDTSPRTGERAKDTRSGAPLFYGWTGVNLTLVGAPMCGGNHHPSPDSQDPVYPGVVVIRVPYGPGGAFTGGGEVSTVLVGTLSNLRNGDGWTDGCGFAMYMLTWDGQCNAGKWNEWGLRKDGRGTFRLCPR